MMKKKIKFSNEKNQEFIIELRKKVNAYFHNNRIEKTGNINMVLKTIFMFALYLAPYFIMISGVVTNPLVLLILWLTMGLGMAGVGLSVMHDANHRSYSKYSGVNTMLSYSLALLGGSVLTWQHQHNTLHHGFTNIYNHDEDISPGKFMRFTPSSRHYKIHRFQHYYAWFFYAIMTLSWATIKDYKQIFRFRKDGFDFNSKKSLSRIIFELSLTKIFYFTYILVIPIILLSVPWWIVIFYFLSMQIICGLLLAIIFQSAHVVPSTQFPIPNENGNIENNWAVHQVLTTTNFSPKSRIFYWLIGGLNYQIEHHLFPNICHVHYKKLSKIVKETTMQYGLPYNVKSNFILAVWEHAKMLRSLGMNMHVG
jgi:linoleoyl-CoA desaturase